MTAAPEAVENGPCSRQSQNCLEHGRFIWKAGSGLLTAAPVNAG